MATVATDVPVAPTSSTLLGLSNLPPSATTDERRSRLATLQSWLLHHSERMESLLTSSEYRDVKTGCMPFHWMAGTGFDEAIEAILNNYCDQHGCWQIISVDQHAHHPSTHRTPLHYAARNGHLSTCVLLIEKYGANPHPKCGRGGVTPLQLAVWQNRLSIVRYLVEHNGLHVVHERNGFNCGLMHWIGLVPSNRWGGDDDDTGDNDGSGVVPLARYLNSLGVAYISTTDNSNTQGHTPNHKAAWGGNLPLMQYFRDAHDVYDTIQDAAGNYAADIAKMRGNKDCYQWLLEHGSGTRADSYRTLGLEVGADMDVVRSRYLELARAIHPDKQQREIDDENKEEIVDDFVKIKAAYEHLTKEGGIGQQKNPKFDELKLLEDHKLLIDANNAERIDGSDDNLFMARLIAILSDYGDDGFPVALIARRWNQIWPDRPFPHEYVIQRSVRSSKHDGDGSGMMLITKKVKLLKWLKWKRDQCNCKSVYFCNRDGEVLAFNRASTKTTLQSPDPKEYA